MHASTSQILHAPLVHICVPDWHASVPNAPRNPLITDDNKSHDMGSDIYYFIEQGMKVKIDNSPSHMHHKFAVFDNKIMINGSFNWTRSASKNNNEDIVVNSNPDLIKSFSKRFEKLWASCVWVK